MISDHTRLMNIFIAFTRSDKHFPRPFKKLGYSIDSIEPFFRNNNSEIVNPDLLFSSNKLNHSIILECKGGGIDIDQINKYNLIVRDNFLNITSIVEPTKLGFDVTIACSETSSNKLSKTKLNISNPILTYVNSRMILSKSYGKFKKKELNEVFDNGIEISSDQPLNYYPFSCEDSIIHISSKILQTIIHYAIRKKQEFTIDDILKDSHPLWIKFDDSYKRKMREKIKKIMESEHFLKINEHIKKSRERYKINVRTLQSLQETCKKLIEDLQKQSKQMSLSEFK